MKFKITQKRVRRRTTQKLSQPSSGMSAVISPVLSRTSIDLTHTGCNELYRVPLGKRAIVTAIIMRLTSAVDARGNAEISVGTGGIHSDFSDILPCMVSRLEDVGDSYHVPVEGHSKDAESGEAITLDISAGDCGVEATATVDLIGYLI